MSKNDVMDTDEERKGSPPCSASASRPQAGRQLSGPVSEMQSPPVKNVFPFLQIAISWQTNPRRKGYGRRITLKNRIIDRR